MTKTLGQPLSEDLALVPDMPHTISYAIIYRSRIDSFNELPKDKRPPRNLWDKPNKLSEYIDKVFEVKGAGNQTKSTSFYDFDPEDVE